MTDSSQHPTFTILRLPNVKDRTGFSRSTILSRLAHFLSR